MHRFQRQNKAYPKDEFLLPNIDNLMILLLELRCSLLWMNFLGYNQIKLTSKYQHKIAFTTPWGTFCYKVIPFSLKNIGSTYQWVMMYIFHDYMHDIVEDYVDDVLAKSKTQEDHPKVLMKIFDRLIEHSIQLNPKKCVFGVTSEKLLGFIISKQGIEVDPNKIKAIVNMQPQSNIK